MRAKKIVWQDTLQMICAFALYQKNGTAPSRFPPQRHETGWARRKLSRAQRVKNGEKLGGGKENLADFALGSRIQSCDRLTDRPMDRVTNRSME